MIKNFFLALLLGATTIMSAQMSSYQVSPISADQQVFSFTDPNFAFFDNGARERSRLVVVLGAKGYVPEHFQRFDSFAASLGFHVIGLSFNNSPSVSELCPNSKDEDCFYNSRRQVITGEAISQTNQVDTSHSIVLRLKNMVKYLHGKAPNEGWDQYVSSTNDVKWNKVIVVGHSEGANFAALMGKMYPLERVLCFSPLPERSVEYNRPAKWLSMDGALRQSEYYTFYQEKDTVTSDSTFFKTLSLYDHDNPLYVEDLEYPYNFSRNLRTRFISDYDHDITMVDGVTPIELDGLPKFTAVWGYMLTNDVITSIKEVKEEEYAYPNPFRDVLNISSNNALDVEWVLRDAFGKMVLSGHSSQGNTAHLPSGLYYLSISGNDGVIYKKLLKE